MAKKKSILFTCENKNCNGKWYIGFNRINQRKYTPCPKCGKHPSTKQKILANLEKDDIMLKTKNKMNKKINELACESLD